MSLTDTIKEIKEQLAEEEKEIDGVEEEIEKEESPKEEVKEEAKEEPKEEQKEEKEEAPDHNAFQRMRREAAAAKKLAEETAAENASLKAKLAEPKDDEAREETQPNPEIDEMVRDHRMSRAEREFQSLEAKFRRSTPEYDAVAQDYGLALAQSIKMQNPRLTNSEVAERTKESILLKAADYLKQGFDPIEEMYHDAKELGFTGKKQQKSEETKETETKDTEVKPDMKKVAENRKRSTGMTSSNGESKGQITKQSASEYTPAEWKKLPTDEKRRLMYG